MMRYYILFDTQPTMFEGIYAVEIAYGRIRKSTHCIYKLFNSLDDANEYRKKCYQTRMHHGYVKVPDDPTDLKQAQNYSRLF
jgi:predicted DNA-binding WGR domain protein